jgi:hypothetical protein
MISQDGEEDTSGSVGRQQVLYVYFREARWWGAQGS